MGTAEWVSIGDTCKPQLGEEVLILIPVCSRHVIESAVYVGDNAFVGAWCSRRGERCTYEVSHWVQAPILPEGVKL